jgi:hypothetical protein
MSTTTERRTIRMLALEWLNDLLTRGEVSDNGASIVKEHEKGPGSTRSNHQDPEEKRFTDEQHTTHA